MFTLAGSAFGNRSTPRSLKEKMPRTTSDMTSIVAKTGRRTQSSDKHAPLQSFLGSGCLPRAFGRACHPPPPPRAPPPSGPPTVTAWPSASVSASLIATGSPCFTPLTILDALTEPIADLQLVRLQLAAGDDEHAVGAVAILQRAVRQREDLIDLRRVDVHAREGAGLEQRARIRHARLEGERARLGVHGRADAGHRARDRLVGKRVDAKLHGLADLNPRRHPLGDLAGDLERDRRGRRS